MNKFQVAESIKKEIVLVNATYECLCEIESEDYAYMESLIEREKMLKAELDKVMMGKIKNWNDYYVSLNID